MKSNNSYFIFLITVITFLATGCSSQQSQTSEIISEERSVVESVTIHYSDHAQFELIDSHGGHVLVDFLYPDRLTTPVTEADILLTTNQRYYTFSEEFLDTFPGEQLFAQEGHIKTDHVSVTGIASAFHRNDLSFPPEGGTNYIYLIEMGGLRIAHLGNIGQEYFTEKQLEILGEIDVVISQFKLGYSEVDTTNKIAFNLMDQLKPKLIIPTYGSGNMEVINIAAEKWEVLAATTESVTISASMLSDNTQFLIFGSNAKTMQSLFEVPEWNE